MVERVKFPLALNEFVTTGVHLLNGSARLVLCSSTYVPLVAPLVAIMVKVVPLTLTLVIVGEGGRGSVTIKFTFPPLTDIIPVPPDRRNVPDTACDPVLAMAPLD